ncbi:MAG: DUF11 domain-containing protein, partial [Acidimicrobiia bacterium]|nr:DUF11 domain-containing protein [Acidimicrobiia bacterium]
MSSRLRSTGRQLAALFTVVVLVCSGSAIAIAQQDGGHEGEGGLACSDLVAGSRTLTISPGAFTAPVSGSDGVADVTVTPGESDLGPIFGFTSNIPVDAAIVAGGPKVMAWEYEPPTTMASGLHAPLNMEGTHYHKPKTISVCYRVEAPEIALSLSKSDSTDPVRVGDRFDYLITVSNTGGEPLSAVRIEDPIPALVGVVTVDGCPTWDGSALIVCEVGVMEPDSSVSIVITVEALKAGIAINHATASATTPPGSTLSEVASEATAIEKMHGDGGDDHEHGAPSCDVFAPGLVAILAGEEALHGTTAVVADETATVTLSLYQGDMGTLFDWMSTYPIAGVITVGGPETLAFPYPPLTFSGSGLHAPLSGGGTHYRGLRQAAFCYQPGPFVDVGVDIDVDESRVLVGDAVQYTVTVVNRGVATAMDVSLAAGWSDSLHIDWIAGWSVVGEIDAGQQVVLSVNGEAGAVDEAAVMTVTVAASNEDDDMTGDNTAATTIEILETTTGDTEPEPESPPTSASLTTTTTGPEVLGASTTTTIAPATLDTLPFTGASADALAGL